MFPRNKSKIILLSLVLLQLSQAKSSVIDAEHNSNFRQPKLEKEYTKPEQRAELDPNTVEILRKLDSKESAALNLEKVTEDKNQQELFRQDPNQDASTIERDNEGLSGIALLKTGSFMPFGQLDDADTDGCVWKQVVNDDVVEDEVIQCQKTTEKKCYTSQETVFDTYTTEVCDETYSKNCHISFLEESNLVPVEVCFTEARRICNDEVTRKRKAIGDFESENTESCLDVFDTVCETYNNHRVVSDDYADCQVQSLEICQRGTACPKVPKTTCVIISKNVTKDIPESKCKKIKRNVCGPVDCPIRLLPEICKNETKQASSKVPVEKCSLIPKQECRDVSILVPSLVPVEKCINIPKELCTKVLVPRKIDRISNRLFCGDGTDIGRDVAATTIEPVVDG